MKQLNMKIGYTSKFLRQRKFLLIMPIVVVPLVSFLGWSTGLVGSMKANDKAVATTTGLNTTLPGAAMMKDSSWSKLNFYEAADKEAAKRASLAKSDPYYQLAPMGAMEEGDTNLLPVSTRKKNGLENYAASNYTNNQTGTGSGDPNEVKVYQKLDALNKALEQGQPNSGGKSSLKESPLQTAGSTNDNDINRLEAMMQQINNTGNSSNPEMDQVNRMLEKVLDIQHPERVTNREQGNAINNKQPVFPVEATSSELAVTTLQNARSENDATGTTGTLSRRATFYSLEEEEERAGNLHNATRAIIPEEQVLVNGATVKLQLSEDVYINGVLVSKGQAVFGEASLQNERLKIEIHSIRYQHSILPVKLSVYDLDGVEGIYIPGAIGREVAKQSTDQAIQSIGISSLDPSIGAQAANAGIQAAKSFIGKKAKQVRVTVRAGYEVLLRDQTNKN